jgi:MFS family permease
MSFLVSNRTAEPDSAAAWTRLAAALLAGSVACVGGWTVVVALPVVEAEFGSARAGASFPYTMAMLGFAAGTFWMGKLSDRYGVVAPILLAAFLLAAGYGAAGFAPSLIVFALAHVLVGLGASAGFAPLIADLSHWFTRRRGFAVVSVAAGNYLAGALWPPLLQQAMDAYGWRAAHVATGLIAAAILVPLAFLFRLRPQTNAYARAAAGAAAKRAALGLSPRALQLLLTVAGFACCMAMAMPQVHIVAYCGDLGYGVARGAQMLSLMLGLGIVSRLLSGVAADRFGAVVVLLVGSFMQAVALFLYLFFDGVTSLYVISGLFGLFQGGIIPMYAVIVRDFLPPQEAGARIGLVTASTIIGMAVGGWAAGWIHDLTGGYRMAFLHGIAWNALNLAIVVFLLIGPRAAREASARTA